MEGIFLKPIQRLQKYPLFFKVIIMTLKLSKGNAMLPHGENGTNRMLAHAIGFDEPDAKG